MKIGERRIGNGCDPYIIGEAGLNHGGDAARAVEMVRLAKLAGCDAVKFQTYRAAEFCRPNDPMFETFKRCELEPEVWPVLKAECDRVEIDFLSTPQNRSDLDILLRVGIKAIKVGSDDFCNCHLLEDYASEGLPMIVSTGMASERDIRHASSILDARNTVFMLCTSQYPCPTSEARLARLRTLSDICECVGFSDHTSGPIAAIMATALGACVFEKHFKLNVGDAPEAFAEDFDGLGNWVSRIRQAHEYLGAASLTLTDREREQRYKYQRRSGERLRGHA